MLTTDRPSVRRGLLVWDVVVSVVALAASVAVVVAGTVGALVLVTRPGACATCGSPAALVSVGGPVVVAIAAGFAGLALTVLRIVDRRVSWPFAVATLAVCTLAIGLEELALL